MLVKERKIGHILLTILTKLCEKIAKRNKQYEANAPSSLMDASGTLHHVILSDDRISGSGKFVEQIIKEAEARIEYQFPGKEHPGQIRQLSNMFRNRSFAVFS